MNAISALVLACALVFPGLVVAGELVASSWVDFREASIRLLVEPKPGAGKPLRGAVEIRLMQGYKTYWRTAGDSGVPPILDFSKTNGIGRVETYFPFPARFDDGAGGTAFGYVGQAILPFEAERSGDASGALHVKLDFAVCGTMCIPLSGEMVFNPASSMPATSEDRAALEKARRHVPVRLAPEKAAEILAITRDRAGDKPGWIVMVRHAADPARFQLFPEAKGYLQPEIAKSMPDGRIAVRLSGEAAPGSGGRFGIARLTFGDGNDVFEALVDLDASPVAP